MLDLDETFIFDSVTHSYNFAADNFAIPDQAAVGAEMLYQLVERGMEPEYSVTRQSYLRDWDVEETANMLFLESHTDVATFHPTAIPAFEDGLVSVEKAAQVKERWPDRFLVFAAVDPLEGEAALQELERQVEMLDPVGVKLYPSSWQSDHHVGWSMDDPEVAYPVFEKAKELGLDYVAVHKALPLGTVPMDSYKPGDVEDAAGNFPGITFSIVHGGLAFTEETAWQLARFPNVRVNIEGLGGILTGKPRSFGRIMAELMQIGGEDVVDRLFWSSSAMGMHPRPQLEAFADFTIPKEVRDRVGPLTDVPELTDEHKRKILGENYANEFGIDVEARRERIADDEFASRRSAEGLAAPYSTTEAEVEAEGLP
jgi:predicted TIM-barrel fold metal-dependent hydrolase